MALTTTVGGVWVLQALLGVETMPASLRLKPFVPSVHESLMVQTTAGRLPLSQTAEYASLMQAGVIDSSGRVDDVVRDWMTVLGRPEREVMLVIRRPADVDAADAAPTVTERVLVVCRHRRWMAMAARDGDEMVIDAVGEAEDPHKQIELICQTLLPALGEAPPADIEGVNLPADLVQSTLERAVPLGRDAVAAALGRLGLAPQQAQVLTAAARLDESAMAVVAVVDHGIKRHVHQRVLTVADTEYGRISITTTPAADGSKWMSIWPASIGGLHDDLADLLAVPRAA
ncbi:ESX secretion-associated protein EspG [Mycobacterium branderi]|uniref:ESX secretion-associated protein EspG n=1 Tax=Mycobacterium branderi TaxID=43348 RepID=A0A7I7WD27_9MYCO|nr:ESX secretion-associated protein EspG [Mycobacterium branderi]MCV7235249.1 ESX secretion-associated protein EspG [Mycobacterium branderi]ORA29850.1 ESX secretion-associated protein EspG [Mycobacterium branderi]BBZ15020.1 ESX-2 secretion-associated protein EspG2 [Mycobacterium branderi]